MTRPDSQEAAVDQEALSRSLKIVARGGLMMLVGLFMAHVFTFTRRLIIIRVLTESGYGLFSLGMSILLFVYALSTLGLDSGAQRYIALYRGRNDPQGVKGTIYTAGGLSAISILVITAGLMLCAKPIASLLDKPDLAWVLFTLAFMMPAMRFVCLVSAFYQGFEIIWVKALLVEVGVSFLTMVAVIVALLLDGGLLGVLLAYILGYLVVLIVTAAFLFWKFPVDLRSTTARYDVRLLLSFSIPLAFAAVAREIMVYIDTIMLGYFETARQVGIYNAAVPLYRILPLFLMALGFIYSPVAARLIGEKKGAALDRLYTSVTKWLFLFTIPGLCICLFYPSDIIALLFGTRYTGAAFALQMLALGELIHTLLGPNARTLVAFGRTRIIMVATISTGAVNMLLNLWLIPRYGINGAAMATAVSLVLLNLMVSWQLYRHYRIHPFHTVYLKPLLLSAACLAALYYPMKTVVDFSGWMLPACFIVFMAVTLGSVVVTRGIDDEDRALYRAIKERFFRMLPGKSEK